MAYKRSSKRNVYGKGRRTYKKRDYPGRNGPFSYKQKMLIRYSGEKANKLVKQGENIVYAIVEETKRVIKDVAISKKSILEKGRAYYEEQLKRLCPVDTGMLRDGFKVKIVNGWLEWSNKAEYVYAQNYGMAGITPTGGEYYYPGYYFLEKAGLATFKYMTDLMKKEAKKAKNKAISRGGK